MCPFSLAIQVTQQALVLLFSLACTTLVSEVGYISLSFYPFGTEWAAIKHTKLIRHSLQSSKFLAIQNKLLKAFVKSQVHGNSLALQEVTQVINSVHCFAARTMNIWLGIWARPTQGNAFYCNVTSVGFTSCDRLSLKHFESISFLFNKEKSFRKLRCSNKAFWNLRRCIWKKYNGSKSELPIEEVPSEEIHIIYQFIIFQRWIKYTCFDK